MKNRTIQHIIYAATYNMGGFPVRQPLPSKELNNLDPFLLLHHADVKVPENVPVKKAGVGPHPHRGFSPVTFIFKGGVHHQDSRGNNNTIYEGGTQWMNAGMGIIHSERPPYNIHEIGGRQEIIQLWVNTPAKDKMKQPAYYPATAEEIPYFKTDDGLVKVNVVSGSLNGIKGPVPATSQVNTFTVEFKAGGKYVFPVPSDHNAFIYLLDGLVKVNSTEVKGKYAIVFNNDGEGIEVEALEDTRLFIGTGEPLNEKIASHGPFVMNTETELLEAFRDYEMGKMGVLIEE